MALNAPIQGSAADIIKKAMIDLDVRLARADLSAEMILQIHDELILEVPFDELEQVTEMTIETMEHVTTLTVPLRIAFGTGRTLAEAGH